jgi:hypothetical protein
MATRAFEEGSRCTGKGWEEDEQYRGVKSENSKDTLFIPPD